MKRILNKINSALNKSEDINSNQGGEGVSNSISNNISNNKPNIMSNNMPGNTSPVSNKTGPKLSFIKSEKEKEKEIDMNKNMNINLNNDYSNNQDQSNNSHIQIRNNIKNKNPNEHQNTNPNEINNTKDNPPSHPDLYNESHHSYNSNFPPHKNSQKDHSHINNNHNYSNSLDNNNHIKTLFNPNPHFKIENFNKIHNFENYTNINPHNIFSNNFLQPRDFLPEYFRFKNKISKGVKFNQCLVNYFLRIFKKPPSHLDLSQSFIQNLKLTKEVEIYTLLNDNTNMVYLVLKKLIEVYSKDSLKKITIFQVGIKTVDELMYTILASFLRGCPNVDSVSVIEKITRRVHEPFSSAREVYDTEERLENPIINRQHFFNFYQSLSSRTNLVELRILFFLKDYNFVMLSHVLMMSRNLRILQVRNLPNKETENRERELDFAFNELNSLGENLRDEIFIFFNYLSSLEYLEQLSLTHFWFNSEINFLACEMSKSMKSLKYLNLDRNQTIVNNDHTAMESFNFESTNLEYLNISGSFLYMIRKFDSIIHLDKLLEVNIGVLDYISFSTFLKFIPTSSLSRATVTLNKPTSIESLPFIFEQISDHPFRARNLKFLFILNLYTYKIYKRFNKIFNLHLFKLIEKMKLNNTIRKLSFKKPCVQYTSIRESEIDLMNGFRTFRYINKKDYNSAATLILILKKLFLFDKYEEADECGRLQKEIFFNQIFRNIVQFRYANYRKIVLE